MRLWQKISRLLQPSVFDGEIGCMVVVAAPAGAGKSTFLDRLSSNRGLSLLPEHLSYAARAANSHLHLFQLYRHRARRIEEVAVHCDILAPLIVELDAPYQREQVIESIDVEIYRNHQLLSRYFGKAEQLDIVILYVGRPKNLQRWLVRERQSKKASGRYDRVTWVLEERSNKSELHRAMYSAWLQYCESMKPRSITIIDANDDDNYALVQIDDFRRQLDEGY